MESAESLSSMEDSDGRNEQITEIISMIKTTMASTEYLFWSLPAVYTSYIEKILKLGFMVPNLDNRTDYDKELIQPFLQHLLVGWRSYNDI
ncbi:Norsolorinic acid synthase stcA [Trichinella spiralis]|uniref:Norsolorinic acid synthase stcA n=1 Tax=Trichinella spiralis TaxID=6334 RepID=A0ABR3K292_TRISP